MTQKHHTKSDYIVTIDEFPGIVFSTLSGGQANQSVTLIHPGGSPTPEALDGKRTIEPITITKHRNHFTDKSLIKWMNAKPGLRLPEKVTVTKTPVNKLNIPNGEATKFLRCKVTNADDGDVNSESSEAQMLSITLQPEDKV